MQSQFGKVEEGRLKLVVWVREFPRKFVYHNDTHVGVVTPTNEAIPKLSLLKIWSQNHEQFCKYDEKYGT